MNTLNRAGLLPAGRQDWAETVWAEAHEVPLAGRPGLDDRAGSADAAPRRAGLAALFTIASYIPCAARPPGERGCWPGGAQGVKT